MHLLCEKEQNYFNMFKVCTKSCFVPYVFMKLY